MNTLLRGTDAFADGKRKLSFIVSAILAVLFLFLGIGDLISANKTPLDLDTLSPADITENIRVKGNAYFALDCFASYGDDKSDDYRYYIVPVGEESSSFFIALKVEKNDYATLDKLVDFTYNFMVDADVSEEPAYAIDGKITKMEKKVYNYYEEYFIENEWYTEEELNEAMGVDVLPYCIEINNDKIGYVYLIVAAVFAIYGGLVLWRVIIDARQNKEMSSSMGKPTATQHSHSSAQATASLGNLMQDDEKPPMGFED